MAKRDTFLLRIDPRILQGIRQWSEDEMRSMNGQIEYLLRRCLQEAGRISPKRGETSPSKPRTSEQDRPLPEQERSP